ncbi:MAG TPA: ABC transporter permease [Candidatus Limnocylindrales bacterium]|jgi:general nucleoside transport system permease protein
MSGIIQSLNGLPALGEVFQFLGYVVANIGYMSQTTVAVAVPITLAALCGVMCERSGVVNIGLEGIMLTSAFVGWIVGAAAVGLLGDSTPSPIFGATLPLMVGLIAAILAGMAVSLLHAWLAISLRVDQIISGTIINIGAVGITGYVYSLIASQSPVGAGSFAPYDVPKQVADLPLVGWLINAVLSQGPIGITAIVIVIILQIMLFRSRWGLRTRAVGEHPRAAETVGIDVIRLRYRNVVMSGALAALGGAWLTMEHTNKFDANMTAGRGFIGLAAMIVGRWTPLGACGAALLFASATALSTSLQISPPSGDLGQLMGHVPGEFWEALPYIITIVILAGLIGRSIAPAADGQPYERESAS